MLHLWALFLCPYRQTRTRHAGQTPPTASSLLAGALALAPSPLLPACVRPDPTMARHPTLLLAALALVAAAAVIAPTPVAADVPQYAAVIAIGDKGVWPYCAVTGWKPLTLPLPAKYRLPAVVGRLWQVGQQLL
eukprot:TRINITY_DN1377_c0_g1_i2.p2 TRINITY_DN1377_c0_g1~~TRINITY_DN1377_c0_g1_i2.p2  ORF type:complete len:134 (-),score=15.74 TRINITY_DN1377_c0_g1_i2:460-861(-)